MDSSYHILIFTLLLILWPQTFLHISAVEFPINVWPKPTSTIWLNPLAIKLSRNFNISGPTRHTHLAAAVLRYREQIVNEVHRPLVPPNLTLISSPHLETLQITVSDFAAALAHGVDESYTLNIPCTGEPAALSARTPWGAMRGLETFSQLVYLAPQRAVACGLNISDAPLFPHRGVLLDTSRNYYVMKDLLRLIDALSMNKMNVFHWHITDSHSFPLQLPKEPGLAANGSYGKEMVYTEDDVRRLVNYGMERGVRIVPEIDMPAHTGSWSKAYPEIVTCADMFWWPAGAKWEDRLASEPGTGQLNPLNRKTYKVVKNVVRDITTIFPDPFFHAGNDEIVPNCWKTDPTIAKYLSKNKTLSQVLQKFVGSTLPYILSMNRTVVYWEDVLLDAEIKVDPTLLPTENVILQSWNNGPNNTKRIVSSGYRAIVSSADFYYLDCGHGDFVGNDSQYDQAPGMDQGNGGSWCGPFKTWQTIYNYDITYGLSKEEAMRVLGGEVALWSEQADGTVMDSRIWPRGAAAAESWWSGNRDSEGKKRYGEATDRLIDWRYRMVERGIGAEPIQPQWCRKNPGMCNTVQSS